MPKMTAGQAQELRRLLKRKATLALKSLDTWNARREAAAEYKKAKRDEIIASDPALQQQVKDRARIIKALEKSGLKTGYSHQDWGDAIRLSFTEEQHDALHEASKAGEESVVDKTDAIHEAYHGALDTISMAMIDGDVTALDILSTFEKAIA